MAYPVGSPVGGVTPLPHEGKRADASAVKTDRVGLTQLHELPSEATSPTLPKQKSFALFKQNRRSGK